MMLLKTDYDKPVPKVNYIDAIDINKLVKLTMIQKLKKIEDKLINKKKNALLLPNLINYWKKIFL